MINETNSWYVLHVRTGQERDVAEAIQALPDTTAIVPMRIMLELRRGAWTEVSRTLFPAYVFCKTLLTASRYYELVNISGVIRMLGSGSSLLPLPVPETEMSPVLALGMGGRPIGISQAVRTSGGRIRIIEGPLRLLPGRITRIDARRRRATVELPLMGEDKPVQLALRVINNPT